MKHENYQWISKIIKSCSDDFHFEGVDKLIELFYIKEKDEELTEMLKQERADKWNHLHAIVV